MTTDVTPQPVPTGNTYDKYGSTNPVVRRLMEGFESTLDELWAQAAPQSILDVGCGEGVLTEKWADRLGGGRIVGIDLDDPKLRAEWEERRRPNLEYRVEDKQRQECRDRQRRQRGCGDDQRSPRRDARDEDAVFRLRRGFARVRRFSQCAAAAGWRSGGKAGPSLRSG